MRTIPKLFFSAALAGSALVMVGCQTVEPYVSYPYEVTAQNARILKRLEVKDVACGVVSVFDNIAASPYRNRTAKQHNSC